MSEYAGDYQSYGDTLNRLDATRPFELQTDVLGTIPILGPGIMYRDPDVEESQLSMTFV